MSYHALTCDPDCPGTDCLCDCPCHPNPVAAQTNRTPVRYDKGASNEAAPAGNRGLTAKTIRES